MDKQSKKKIVKTLKESFQSSSGVIVTHYLGLNSTELTELRNQVKEVGTGLECGISIKDFIDFKEKDVIESYLAEEIQRSI